jgi:hypothetical protein
MNPFEDTLESVVETLIRSVLVVSQMRGCAQATYGGCKDKQKQQMPRSTGTPGRISRLGRLGR